MNGLQQKEEREDMLAVRHLKAELGKKHLREIKCSGGKEEGRKRGGATTKIIYGWSSARVEAFSPNDKWVSSDRVLY